jgi:hypothetical protein
LFANNDLTALTADDTDNAKTNTTNLFANNDLTALTADDTDNAKTNTTIKKSTTTTKEPKPTSIIRKFVPSRLDVSFYCFHLIIFIKLIFNIFIIFLYQPALASTASSSSPSTGASSTISSRQQQSKKTAEGAFIV